ncbi:MAG TPA: 2-amino-4-hydroxy-6-hydroxymethyldihydropteridine diphosphokinase [Anaerolineaceae bacterium]|nr:2-amino-4-hydroxy-6-hydroxymethyldihydropteridine diphosphokinase [Anaerolineaceae bacterium]
MNAAYLLMGSNIDPVQNTRQALALLRARVRIVEMSNAWETPSFGSPGPNYINLAIHIETDCDAKELKTDVIRDIERNLGRVRTADKNAPRTIDIDLIIFNDELLVNAIWVHPHIMLPMAELIPDLRRPQDGIKLCEISQSTQHSTLAVRRADLDFR